MKNNPQYQEFISDDLIENKNTPFYPKHVTIIGYLDNFDTEDDARECAKQYKTYCITNMRLYNLYLIRRERDKVIEPLQNAIKALKDVKNIFYDKLNE